MKPLPAGNEFAAFIGIDWADAKHDICLQATNAARRESSVLPHRPDAIEAWAADELGYLADFTMILANGAVHLPNPPVCRQNTGASVVP